MTYEEKRALYERIMEDIAPKVKRMIMLKLYALPEKASISLEKKQSVSLRNILTSRRHILSMSASV